MPTNNSINTGKPIEVSNGGSGTNTFTAYSVLTGGTAATNPFQNVSGVGTAGQVLSSSGAAALPTWDTPYLVKLESQTANNSASLVFNTGFSTSYKSYVLLVSNFLPATNNANLAVQLSTDAGGTFATAGYTGGIIIGYLTSIYSVAGASAGYFLLMTSVKNDTRQCNGIYYLHGFSTGRNPSIQGTSTFSVNTTPYSGFTLGYSGALNANAFRVICDPGNITQGTFTLYGLA